MDQLDLKIFRCLGFLPYGQNSGDFSRLNPWVIAKKVGVAGNTVKVRIDKMKKSGFIQYFQIYPNFRLLGMNGAAYIFEVTDILKKNEIIQKCSLVDGVTEIHNFLGESLCIDFTYHDERDEKRKVELLQKLTQSDSADKFYERVMPPVEISLSSLDWKIIQSLRYDAFKPLPEVARDLGLTAKTVRRRFLRLTRNNAVIIVPMVNPAHIVNTITYVMLLYPLPERWSDVLEKTMAHFGHYHFLTRISKPENFAVYLTARTLAETEDNLILVKKMDGIREAKVLILRELKEFTEWLDSAIHRKIIETGKATA